MKRYILLGGFFAFSGCDNSTIQNDTTTNDVVVKNDNNSTTNNDIIEELSGTVVDGYISGAIVCIDENKNNKCDANEPTTITNNKGKYKFKILNKKYKGQIISSGGIDMISGKNFNNILKANINNNKIVNLNPISTIAASLTIKNNKDVAISIGINEKHINKDVYKEDNKNTFIYGLKLQKLLDVYRDITRSSDEEYNVFLTKFSDSNFKGTKKALNYFLKNILEEIDIKLNKKSFIEMRNIISDILLLSEHDEEFINMSEEEICKMQYKLDNRRDLIIDFLNKPNIKIDDLYNNIEALYKTEEYSNTFRLLEILNITNNIAEKIYYLKTTPEIFNYPLKCNSTVLELEFLIMEDLLMNSATKKFYLSIIDNERKKYDLTNIMFYEKKEKLNIYEDNITIK